MKLPKAMYPKIMNLGWSIAPAMITIFDETVT